MVSEDFVRYSKPKKKLLSALQGNGISVEKSTKWATVCFKELDEENFRIRKPIDCKRRRLLVDARPGIFSSSRRNKTFRFTSCRLSRVVWLLDKFTPYLLLFRLFLNSNWNTFGTNDCWKWQWVLINEMIKTKKYKRAVIKGRAKLDKMEP